jgi:hypothetical protein
LFGAYPSALICVPVYLTLRRRLRPKLVYVAATAGLTVMAPWSVLLLFSATANQYQSTWSGLQELAGAAGAIFLLGALGGLVFWFCAVWRDPNPDRYLASHGASGSRASISS